MTPGYQENIGGNENQEVPREESTPTPEPTAEQTEETTPELTETPQPEQGEAAVTPQGENGSESAGTETNTDNPSGGSGLVGIGRALLKIFVLLLILVVLMPYAALIPMPTIAAILFMVAYNMSGWRKFVYLLKTAPKSDIIVLVLTFGLTVVFDLVVAIEVNVVLAAMLFMKRMSEETAVEGWKYVESDDDDPDSINLRDVAKNIRVYELSGPLFFGAADKIAEIHAKDFNNCLILRMRSVNAIDATAMHALELLWEKCQKKNVTLIFSHVNEQPMSAMKKSGLYDKVGAENFCAHIDDALERGVELGESRQ